MNSEINIDNTVLYYLSDQERQTLKDGIKFIFENILLKSANTVLGKNINYNRDIIKPITINNLSYYIHPILSKRGIDTIFRVSIKITRVSIADIPIATFRGEYNSITNFTEEIDKFEEAILNPTKPEEEASDTKDEAIAPEPIKPSKVMVKPVSRIDDDGSEDDTDKSENAINETPLAAGEPYKPTLHNANASFPDDKAKKRHIISRKKKSKKRK